MIKKNKVQKKAFTKETLDIFTTQINADVKKG